MTTILETDLDRQAIQTLQKAHEEASPQDILRWAVQQFGERLAVVTSFGPTGIVTLHMLNNIEPDISVLTLDTGLLFPETYALISEMEARFGLNLTRIKPELTVEEQAVVQGDALWERDPDKCCAMRKIAPLGKALDGYVAWIAGIRRDQPLQRASTPIIARDPRYDLIKLSPLATWSEEMVWSYIRAHDLPYNPLHDRGYPSIGCLTCTKAVGDGDGYSRAGRWSASGKLECGIHLAANGV